MYKLFGREPTLWSGLFSSAVMLISAFWFPLTAGQQSVLNAFCTAVFGFLTWWFVARDGSSAAILGLLKTVLALGIAFGLHLSPENQAVVMTFAATVTAMFVRTQVTPVMRPFSPPFRKFSVIERTERMEHSTGGMPVPRSRYGYKTVVYLPR
jgi:hypothetical protein